MEMGWNQNKQIFINRIIQRDNIDGLVVLCIARIENCKMLTEYKTSAAALNQTQHHQQLHLYLWALRQYCALCSIL